MPPGLSRARPLLLAILLATVTFASLLTDTTHADTLDPCSGEGLGPSTVDNHVCYNAETIKTVHDSLNLDSADADDYDDLTFVSFTIVDHGRWTVIQNGTGSDLTLDPAKWSDPLPAGTLELNTTTTDTVTRVHLKTPMTSVWDSALDTVGVDVLASQPNNWFVANISDTSDGWVGDLPFVDGVEPISTDAVLDDRLSDASGATKINAVPWGQIERLFNDVCKAVAGLGGTVNQATSGPATGIVSAEIEAANLTALADNPAVAWVQPALNATTPTMSNVRSVTGAEPLHDRADDSDYTGETVTGMVAAIDGVYKHHEELSSSIIHYHDRDRDYTEGCPSSINSLPSFYEPTVDNTDKEHGTPVFGEIFADGEVDDDDSISKTDEAALRGMAPNASGVVVEHKRLQRLQQARAETADHDVSFTSYSWKYVPNGMSDPTQRPAYTLPAMENDLVVQKEGISVYQSMGNSGAGHAAPAAVAKNAISVGGLYHFDDRSLPNDAWMHDGDGGDRASTGPTLGGRIKPDLVGPYELVDTTGYVSAKPNTTETFSGTSAATPAIAGAGALVEQLYDSGEFIDRNEDPTTGTPSPALVKALLINSAHTFDLPVDPSQVGPNADDPENETEYVDPANTRHFQGWGQPNASTLPHPSPDFEIFTVDETVNLETGARYKVDYNLADGAQWLRVSLVWTDPPTPPAHRISETAEGQTVGASSSALVNDLDLEVRSPNGDTYLGNKGMLNDNTSDPVDADDTDAVGYPITGADRVNNVENVFVKVRDTSTWTTTVQAAGVDVDARPSTTAVDQPFGLVIRPMGESDDSTDDGDCCNEVQPFQ